MPEKPAYAKAAETIKHEDLDPRVRAIRVQAYRKRNAPTTIPSTNEVIYNGRPVIVHQTNNFRNDYLRQYFTLEDPSARMYIFDPVKFMEVSGGLLMPYLERKSPELFDRLRRYDITTQKIHHINAIFTEMQNQNPNSVDWFRHVLQQHGETVVELISVLQQHGETVVELISETWPSDDERARVEIDYSQAYDTLCEINRALGLGIDTHYLWGTHAQTFRAYAAILDKSL
ncbi:hypothetical protein KW794_01135 [Candidatus Saccharibacteria bacterium]|nr:hypothetical protein [Candidatus Saccharibacteria bacterium]